MSIVLKQIEIPSFGTPVAMPEIPHEIYAARCDVLLERAGTDWVVVYADREHLANIAFLTGFEPRFEEALLVLGQGGQRVAVVGNESIDYLPLARFDGLEGVVCQSFSLMGQPRETSPALEPVLRDIGLRAGGSVGVVGWKYLAANEYSGEAPSFFANAYVIDVLRGLSVELTDVTPVMMNPADGLRAVVDVHQIAQGEWGAARASDAVWRMVSGLVPGEDEFSAAARMGYAGEEFAVHVMFATAPAGQPVIGLKSPRGRIYNEGEGLSCAVGFWGGLSARSAMVAREDAAFVELAKGYFAALLKWYETVDLGVTGGEVEQNVREVLARAGLRPALNPGHLVGHDEWVHSPMIPGSGVRLRSGMPFQVDVLPVPIPAGCSLNCEDAVTLADAALRAELAALYPEVAARVEARRAFVRDQIGVALKECILPLSNTPLCLAPLLLRPDRLLTVE